jgi:hypothetical protein
MKTDAVQSGFPSAAMQTVIIPSMQTGRMTDNGRYCTEYRAVLTPGTGRYPHPRTRMACTREEWRMENGEWRMRYVPGCCCGESPGRYRVVIAGNDEAASFSILHSPFSIHRHPVTGVTRTLQRALLAPDNGRYSHPITGVTRTRERPLLAPDNGRYSRPITGVTRTRECALPAPDNVHYSHRLTGVNRALKAAVCRPVTARHEAVQQQRPDCFVAPPRNDGAEAYLISPERAASNSTGQRPVNGRAPHLPSPGRAKSSQITGFRPFRAWGMSRRPVHRALPCAIARRPFRAIIII